MSLQVLDHFNFFKRAYLPVTTPQLGLNLTGSCGDRLDTSTLTIRGLTQITRF